MKGFQEFTPHPDSFGYSASLPRLGVRFRRTWTVRAVFGQVVISDSYWRERFQAAPSVVGSAIEIDTFAGGKFTIIGVMPPGFEFPHGVKMWLSLADWGGGPMPTRDATNRCCAWYTTFARMKAGASIPQATQQLTSVARDLSQRYPAMSPVAAVKVEPLRETLAGSYRLVLLTIFGAAGCLLLIACANVANLVLSRGVGRRAELLTRAALGATRMRIARQLIVETLFLTGTGAAAGVIAAVWLNGPIARMLEGRLPFADQMRIDPYVLVVTALATVVAAVLCGLTPLLNRQAQSWQTRGQSESSASKRLRNALVAGELALAVVLVTASGLLVRALMKLQAVDLGLPY